MSEAVNESQKKIEKIMTMKTGEEA